MIFTNFNSMAKCTMGFLIFYALQNVLNVQVQSAAVKRPNSFVHYDVVKAEDDAEMGINNACKASLAGTFNGLLTHDALEVKLDEKATKIQKDYHSLIIHAFATITTGAGLIAYYCDKIEVLIRLGFNGDIIHDHEMASKGTNKLQEGALMGIKEMHRQKYSNFLLGPNMLSQYEDIQITSVLKINMLLEYSKKYKFLNKPVTTEDGECRAELAYDDYSGDLTIDSLIKGDRGIINGNEYLYGQFIDRLSRMNVSNTDQILTNIYCDIMYTLSFNKFTGKKDSDISVQGDPKIEDVAHGYKLFLKKTGNCGSDCIERYAIYRINYS